MVRSRRCVTTLGACAAICLPGCNTSTKMFARNIWKFVVFVIILYCMIHLFYAQVGVEHVDVRSITKEISHEKKNHNGGDTCTEKRNIFFLKIAKTGSTTVQQLLLRFGLVRNLSFMLFANKWAYPSPSFSHLLLPEPNRSTGFDGRYNILCDHTMYNESEVKQLMQQGTFYVTNLRHPFTHVKSYINYSDLFTQLKISKKKDFLEDLLRNPEQHDRSNRTRNIMAKFFGLSRNVSDLAAGDALIKEIDAKFHLVLIMERIDESLVLMKRRLCWSSKDILFLPLRVEEYEGKTNGTPKNKDTIIARHRNWSGIDYALYDHFVRKLQAQISVEDNFDAEMTMFRQIRQRAKDFCRGLRDILRRKPYDRKTKWRFQKYLNTTILFDRSPFDEPFSLTGVDCLLMMVHNDVYRKALTVKQLPEICHLVALQPDRFKGSDEEILPKEIGRNGTLPFYVNARFCRDIFPSTRLFSKMPPPIIWN